MTIDRFCGILEDMAEAAKTAPPLLMVNTRWAGADMRSRRWLGDRVIGLLHHDAVAACDGPEITEPSLIENTEPWRVHFTVSPDTWVIGEPW